LANPGESTEIPVAIGFCMFIRRFAWQLVGPFDAERYGRGYGEEVDWCMRAVALGLAHRLALDTFVHHEGETSFGADGARLREVAQADIDARYPDFNARVQRYLADRPAEAAYRRIDLQRLATRELPKIVVVTHAWGGGVERHVRDLIALLENDVEVLVLRPHGDAHLKLEWARSGEALALYFAVPDDLPELATVLAAAGVSRLHFHHLHGSPQALLTLPERLGLPYDVTLHDYAMLSPTYHLCDLAGVYRDDWRDLAPPPPSRSGEVRWPLDPQAWRALFAPWLSAAERVIAPTHDVARRFELAYPGLVVQVWPHPEATLARPARRIKVLLLGGLSRMKGEAVLAEVTQFVAAHDLGLDFILLGHTSQPLATWPAVPLHLRGSYPDDTHLLALIEQERADVVWFPAQVPETYSFTLSVAMASGLSIVASDLGAFPERLRGYARAWLVPWTSNASAWVGALRRAAQSAGGAARVGP
jgi:glycosyltransferase involved in cell wall biosynthesis